MRSCRLTILLVVLSASGLRADRLEKPYFATTLPGTWAKYESSWERPDGSTGTNIYTYIRASDSDDRVRVEFDTETLSGPGEGTISRQLFVMEPGFDLAMNFLDHTAFTVASVAQTGDGPASLMPNEVIDIVRDSAGDLTNSVTFEGRAKREGRGCDLYAYSYRSGGPHVTLQEGEICLDDTVPFGVVLQKGRVMDAEGKVVSSFVQTLLDSGSGRSGTAALLTMTPQAQAAAAAKATPEAVPSLPLLEAYQGEKIRLLVEVDEGSGGKRLQIKVLNKTEEAYELVVPKGSVKIPADSPLGVLELVIDEEQRFSLSPGGSSAPFAAGQSGRRGATGGSFQLTVYEGQPLFQGSVDVGPLN